MDTTAPQTLYIGTGGGGLSRWRDDRLTTFTTREGLPDNTISQILEDDAGRLWLGSNRGIACVSKRQLDDLAAGKIPVVVADHSDRTGNSTHILDDVQQVSDTVAILGSLDFVMGECDR
jgi:ligand-binding sensor domain-containing protein